MAVAERGLMVIDCVASGRPGHAARNEGENALYKALKILNGYGTTGLIKKAICSVKRA